MKRDVYKTSRRSTAFALVCLSLASCNVAERAGEATAAVRQFHERLNSEQYSSIYADADDTFRAKNSEQDFTALLAAVHRKLGVIKQTSSRGFTVNVNGKGTFFNLSYQTTFSDGTATEAFAWRAADGACKLVSYNINSNALITR